MFCYVVVNIYNYVIFYFSSIIAFERYGERVRSRIPYEAVIEEFVHLIKTGCPEGEVIETAEVCIYLINNKPFLMVRAQEWMLLLKMMVYNKSRNLCINCQDDSDVEWDMHIRPMLLDN